MKLVLALVILAACSKTNDVRLLLGPDDEHLSRGFLCRTTAAPNEFLMQKAFTGRFLHVALVVDVLELDAAGIFPGCRGEELLALCRERNCKKSVRRKCVDNVEVEFPVMFDANNPVHVQTVIDRFHTALENTSLLKDLSDSPVIIRVVAMESCPTGDIDPNLALGCAYSCPVQLDQVSGSIAIGLDTLDEKCEPAVRLCAAFPGN